MTVDDARSILFDTPDDVDLDPKTVMDARSVLYDTKDDQ